MQVISENVSLRTTADCVNLLNALVAPRKWKRVAKMTTVDGDIRTFKNELDEFYTIVTDEDNGARIFPAVDFYEMSTLVKEIKRLSGFYFTFDDYGQVFFNPYTLELWVVGSDGGYGYSTLSVSRLSQLIENDEYDFEEEHKKFIDFNDHESLSEITKVHWEAEYYPDSDDEDDLRWIQLCKINSID